MKKKYNILQDKSGDWSSKRLSGLLLILFGMVGIIFISLYSIKHTLPEGVFDQIKDICLKSIYSGSAILGSTALEKSKNE